MPFRSSSPSTLVAAYALAGALAGSLAPAPVHAAGLGAAAVAPVLGQPLDFVVPLRLEAGESLAPNCVSSEVVLGERRVPSSFVRTMLEASAGEVARVRVSSTEPVDEPVVTVTVKAGCTSSISRRYVLFADPPGVVPASALPMAASTVATAPAFAARPEPVPPVAAAVVGAAPTLPDGPANGRAATTASVVGEAAPSAQGDAAPPRSTPRAAAPRRTAATTSGAARGDARPRPRPAPPVPDPGPRLRLEPADPVVQTPAPAQAVEDALAAVAQAASAARAAAAAASAAAERIATLEGTVAQLRAESQGQRELAAQLRERLAGSDATSRWVTPLLVLVLILAGVALWLAWRLMSVQRQRDAEWRLAVSPPAASPVEAPTTRQPTAPVPFVVSEITTTPGMPPRGRGSPAWPPAAPSEAVAGDAAAPAPAASALDADPLRTQAFAGFGAESDAARDVTIEELIDLEQQAEFFVVLGQDDAAIDLLVEHLRQTGGSSPLPYLKLLEIYGRRGDREAYERTRARFNRRFNAYAPEWGVELSHGRTLEDYPGVIPRLQQVWSRPSDAMLELESLLFRKTNGELFDLPAYREVLFLYSLARDLLDREALASGSVDLLLPMAGEGGLELDPSPPQFGLESAAMPLGVAEERATMPVDLDLTHPEPPSSIFDLPDEPAPRQRPS